MTELEILKFIEECVLYTEWKRQLGQSTAEGIRVLEEFNTAYRYIKSQISRAQTDKIWAK